MLNVLIIRSCKKNIIMGSSSFILLCPSCQNRIFFLLFFGGGTNSVVQTCVTPLAFSHYVELLPSLEVEMPF